MFPNLVVCFCIRNLIIHVKPFALIILALIFTTGTAQTPLPFPVIQGEPAQIYTWTFEGKDFSSAVPSLPSFEGLPRLDGSYMQDGPRNCSLIDLEDSKSKERVGNKIYSLLLLLQNQNFAVGTEFINCFEWSPSFMAGSSSSDYIFVTFTNSSEPVSLMLSGRNSHFRAGNGDGWPETSERVDIFNSNWTKVSTTMFSFTQEIWDVSTSRVITGQNPYEKKSKVYKKFYNLITIEPDGIVSRVIYNLPLASYSWTNNEPDPDFKSQLQVKLSYPNLITISQINPNLQPEQKVWLGTFDLTIR
jgi:hypothetical protein